MALYAYICLFDVCCHCLNAQYVHKIEFSSTAYFLTKQMLSPAMPSINEDICFNWHMCAV